MKNTLKIAAFLALGFSKTAAQKALPIAPAWAASSIDERGKVHLAWAATDEKSVIGYWVGFANSKKDEFALLNGRRLTEPFFDWKVAETSLNDAVHFVVVAENAQHARSRPSPILTLKRPDKSAPLAPFLVGVVQKGDELAVSWKLSASRDAARQILFRRNLSITKPVWEVIDTLDGQIEQFFDDKTLLENWYQYRLAALDEARNQSENSNFEKGQRRFRPDAAKVKNLSVTQPDDGEGLRVALAWQFEDPAKGTAPAVPRSFTVYRATGNGQLAVVARTTESTWSDVSVERGALYSYAVRAHYDEAHLGELSAAKSILLK